MELKDIKGIGNKTLEKLNTLGIRDLKSLLFTFPKSYDVFELGEFSYFDEFTVSAVVSDSVYLKKKGKITIISFKVMVDGIEYKVNGFNMQYLYKILKLNDEIIIKGKWDKEFKTINLIKLFKKDAFKEGITPIYNMGDINNPTISKIVRAALNEYNSKELIIPFSYYQKHGYKTGRELLELIHFPSSLEETVLAQECLKYQELLAFSIKLEIIRDKQERLRKTPKKCDVKKVKELIATIPFELTDDQKKAVNDIFGRFISDKPLNMLLEGDVGSGKTIVSLICSYACFTSNMQVLLMAPTESLAKQHYATYKKYLDNFGVNVSLLTSSTPKRERSEILEALKEGKLDIIIGTHSLLNDEVVFKNLGFIICDEQHKFGVDQRKKARDKGVNPDTLYMTATPIPRTLALTLFNDVELETIHTAPSNRKRTKTYCHTYKDYLKILDFVHEEKRNGRQAYFVAPSIEEDPESNIQSVTRIKADLETYYKGSMRIGLLHGKMSAEEKSDVLDMFMNKELDIIVSTTVIEVGIDNPNASIMVVIDATQFGLSTIHQLRGRVGRGEYQGYCFLLSESKEHLERLRILEETNDGFEISEYDMNERGTGDFLGKEQSGMIKFNFANIFKDNKILNFAREDAKELINDKKVRDYYESQLYSENFD